MGTKKCIICGVKLVDGKTTGHWTGHVHRYGKTVLAGFCKKHTHTMITPLTDCKHKLGCFGKR